jgi:apoptosis-inducing factor 3
MKSGVEKIIASSDSESKLATGVVVNGQTLPADFIIMGVGVAPATSFLKDSGIPLQRDGGIKVDEYLRVPGLDEVYAIGERPLLRKHATTCLLAYCGLHVIGDIAHFPQINGESRRIEHWNVCLGAL